MATQPNRNNELVVSLFNDISQARQAQKGIEAWDQSQPNIHLGTSAILYKGPDGKVKYDRSGNFDWKREATANILVLTMMGAKPLHNVFNMLSGVLSSWSKSINSSNIAKLSAQLDQGKAALVVLCDDYEIQPVSQQLTNLGGSTTIGYSVPASTAAQVEDAVQQSANQQGGKFQL
jgi:Protein of unknown function (DUF1269).